MRPNSETAFLTTRHYNSEKSNFSMRFIMVSVKLLSDRFLMDDCEERLDKVGRQAM